jgi:hypothetical protein
VPEARRLLRLAITPISRAARQFGYAWSRTGGAGTSPAPATTTTRPGSGPPQREP